MLQLKVSYSWDTSFIILQFLAEFQAQPKKMETAGKEIYCNPWIAKKEWKIRESSEPGLSGRILMSLTVNGMFKRDMLMKFISTAIGFLQKLLWQPILGGFVCLSASCEYCVATGWGGTFLSNNIYFLLSFGMPMFFNKNWWWTNMVEFPPPISVVPVIKLEK